MFLTKAVHKLEQAAAIDPVVETVTKIVNGILPPGPVKDALHGRPLGHALHPLLVALPIGLSTGASMLDLTGGERYQPAAQRLVGAAVLSVLPTAASGLADWSELGSSKRPKRVGLVHASYNVVATSLYAASWLARRSGHHRRGALLALLGAGGLAAGGYLGGHLVYSQGVAVSRNADRTPKPRKWTDVAPASDLDSGTIRIEVSGQPVMITRQGGRLYALGAVCSHLGGPLDEGDITADGCVVCPWHGSTFRLDDGSVARGPASVPQIAYEVRTVGDRLEVRAKD
ncbi:Rieske 2Fe-2S domain-containing protein [Georgenia muralis]